MMERKGSLDGASLIQSATAEEAVEFQVEGVDKSIGVFAQRFLGLALADERMGKPTGDPLKTFGHGGAGTSIGWVDFDSGLAKKPPECLEYIVVHEMVHLLEPTHNQRFTALMDRFMPVWRNHRDALNRLPVRQEHWVY